MDNFNINTLQCSLPPHGSYQNNFIDPFIVYCKKQQSQSPGKTLEIAVLQEIYIVMQI